MAKYRCDYLANGQRYSANITAGSRAEAEAKMRALEWAPGCGPIGSPTSLQPTFGTYALLLAAAAASSLITLFDATERPVLEAQSEIVTPS